MFKRLYAVGGVWYVLGGLGVFATCSAPMLFGLSCLGVPVPEILLKYSLVALLIGGAISTIVFNSGNMQVVAQNRTTEMLEKISQQLDDRDELGKIEIRPKRQRYRHRKYSKPTESLCVSDSFAANVSKNSETTESQEEYRCPITGTVIAVRNK